jgi:molybdopterin-dependent oxidoreductase alpha subunit
MRSGYRFACCATRQDGAKHPQAKATALAIRDQMDVLEAPITLLHMNKPNGFDCPGCAWPDKEHTSTFQFCENGAKAVTWEATSKRVTPEFFANHTVTELLGWSDFHLENEGRLTHPMVYDAATDTDQPIAWDDAFARIGQTLRGLPDPDMAEFYTSGRASNEAAFLFQIFAREYGTNNFPDCSNMCHEATSVGLPQSLGVGKGTVLLEDFDKADCIFIFGQNPGTNSPRMMTSLRNAARRGASIISFNPFRERALERFQAPQNAIEMITLSATQISSKLFQVRVGGDVAALKGITKVVVEADEAARAAEQPAILDWDFIRGHTAGIEALVEDLKRTQWPDIERQSGLMREDLEYAAIAYMKSERAIIVYGMGITQHQRGAHNVQQLANLALPRGNIGREGAGLCPVRGHSNVQGDRTVGITEVPAAEFLDRLEHRFGFKPPKAPGITSLPRSKR